MLRRYRFTGKLGFTQVGSRKGLLQSPWRRRRIGADHAAGVAMSDGKEADTAPQEVRSGTLEDACVAKGMRMTEQRRIIARVLDAATDHPDVEELYRRAAAIDSRISIATVYRTVKLFEDAGRHHPPRFRRRPQPLRDHPGGASRPPHRPPHRRGDRVPRRGDRAPPAGSWPSGSASASSTIASSSTACRSIEDQGLGDDGTLGSP